MDGELLKLQFVDIPGHGRFWSLGEQYIADVAIVMYDITQDTLGTAKSYVEDLKTKTNADIVVALVGSKADLSSQRVVNYKVICCCHCPH